MPGFLVLPQSHYQLCMPVFLNCYGTSKSQMSVLFVSEARAEPLHACTNSTVEETWTEPVTVPETTGSEPTTDTETLDTVESEPRKGVETSVLSGSKLTTDPEAVSYTHLTLPTRSLV